MFNSIDNSKSEEPDDAPFDEDPVKQSSEEPDDDPFSKDLAETSPEEQFETNLIAFMEATFDPMIVTNQDGRIVLANTLAEKLFNYSKTELLNLVVEDLMPEHLRAQHVCNREQYLKKTFVKPMNPGSYALNHYGLKKNQEEFPIDISLSSLMINEKFFTLVGMRDLTERYIYEEASREKTKELHEQIARTESTKQFNAQLEKIMHEIRTSLHGARGMLPMLTESLRLLQLSDHHPSQEKFKLFEEITEEVNIINICTEQEMAYINNMLKLSKLKSNKVELNIINCELITTIKNIAISFTAQLKQKHLTLQLNLPELVWIKTDPLQLSEIIINLISNAIKFTEQGGVITLSVVVDVAPTIHSITTEPTIHFVIKDTGAGMSQEETLRLFQRFTQANSHISEKYGGSGLGLSITKEIIELMGGTIQVESEIGQGTIFNFSIKCMFVSEKELLEISQKIPSPRRNHQATMQIPELTDKKILIVDDNEINTTILLKQLLSTKCTCQTASNGKIAIDKHIEHNFDFIFMDLEMPIMDGRQTTKLIRERESVCYTKQPSIIIGISGCSSQESISTALASGIDDYISKPYTIKELYELILMHIPIINKSFTIEQTPSEITLYTPGFNATSTIQSSSSISTLNNLSADNLGNPSDHTPTSTPKSQRSTYKSTKCPFIKKPSHDSINPLVKPDAPTPSHKSPKKINNTSTKCIIS